MDGTWACQQPITAQSSSPTLPQLPLTVMHFDNRGFDPACVSVYVLACVLAYVCVLMCVPVCSCFLFSRYIHVITSTFFHNQLPIIHFNIVHLCSTWCQAMRGTIVDTTVYITSTQPITNCIYYHILFCFISDHYFFSTNSNIVHPV